MWACNRCGREHQTPFDASHCPCPEDPAGDQLRRIVYRFVFIAARVAFAVVFSALLALWCFHGPGMPVETALSLGAQLGLVIGLFWGWFMFVGSLLISPIKPPPPDALDPLEPQPDGVARE